MSVSCLDLVTYNHWVFIVVCGIRIISIIMVMRCHTMMAKRRKHTGTKTVLLPKVISQRKQHIGVLSLLEQKVTKGIKVTREKTELLELHTTPGSSMLIMQVAVVSVTVLQANYTLVSPTTRLRQRKALIRLITSGH